VYKEYTEIVEQWYGNYISSSTTIYSRNNQAD
jgi:hypothetical protein